MVSVHIVIYLSVTTRDEETEQIIFWLVRDKSDDDSSLASPSYDSYVYSSPRHEDLSISNTTVGSTHAINGKPMDSTSIPTNQPTEILAGSSVLADRNGAPNKGERLVL